MKIIYQFYDASYIKKNLYSCNKYNSYYQDRKVEITNLLDAPNLFKEIISSDLLVSKYYSVFLYTFSTKLSINFYTWQIFLNLMLFAQIA